MASPCNKMHLEVEVLNRYEEYMGILITLTVPIIDQNGALSTMTGQSPHFQGGQWMGYRVLYEHACWRGHDSSLPRGYIQKSNIFILKRVLYYFV